MPRLFPLLVLTVATLAGLGWLAAQEKTPAKTQPAEKAPEKSPPEKGSPDKASTRPDDDRAIREAAQEFTKAFEKGDEKTVASFFTEEAEYLDEGGEPIHGRSSLLKAYASLFFKRKALKAECKTQSIRYLGTDLAIEEGLFTITTQGNPPISYRYSALHTRQQGKWLIAMLKEWHDETINEPKLEDLDWLIGTWESISRDLVSHTTYSWSPNKAFIEVEYTVTHSKGTEPPSFGKQTIGIDPAVGQIRSWLFASDEAIGESTWVWEGDHWIIESLGTLKDGTQTSAVNILTPDGSDAFTWRSTKRLLGGESQPDIPGFPVKRVLGKPAPEKPADKPPAPPTKAR